MKKGQVWVETVIYTIIGLVLIALVLAFLMPKITQSRDKLVVEQSIESLNMLDQKIQETARGASGSKRIIPSFSLKKGNLVIDGESNKISLIIDDLKYAYSEPNVKISYGRVEIKTEKLQKNYKITLDLPLNMDIQYAGTETIKTFSPASTPYKFSISNVDNAVIDIKEISGSLR